MSEHSPALWPSLHGQLDPAEEESLRGVRAACPEVEREYLQSAVLHRRLRTLLKVPVLDDDQLADELLKQWVGEKRAETSARLSRLIVRRVLGPLTAMAAAWALIVGGRNFLSEPLQFRHVGWAGISKFRGEETAASRFQPSELAAMSQQCMDALQDAYTRAAPPPTGRSVLRSRTTIRIECAIQEMESGGLLLSIEAASPPGAPVRCWLISFADATAWADDMPAQARAVIAEILREAPPSMD